MSDWNARCARTFPEDQLRSDDQIVQVNEVIDIREFEKVMKRDGRIFMIVRRRLTQFLGILRRPCTRHGPVPWPPRP